MPLSHDGLAIFPLWGIKEGRCECGDTNCTRAGKHPRYAYSTLGKGEKVQGPDGCGYAIATGERSGIFVVDFDSLEALEKATVQWDWPQTYAVETGRGLHLYYLLPNFPVKNSAGELMPGVDIRGDGGFVVAEGSTHKSGLEYQCVDNRDPVAAPEWLLKWPGLRGKTTERIPAGVNAPVPIVPEHADYTRRVKLAEKFATEAPPSIQGKDGSGKLWDVALHLVRRLELPLSVAKSIIDERFSNRCVPPWSEQEIWHKLEDARDKSDMVCGIAPEGFGQALAASIQTVNGSYTFDPFQSIRPTEYITGPDGVPRKVKPKILQQSELLHELASSEEWKGVFRYNEFDQRIYAFKPPCRLRMESGAAKIPDTDAQKMQGWLEVMRNATASRLDIGVAVESLSAENSYSPIRNWLQSLTKPTTCHLNHIAETLFGDDRPIAQEFVRKQLIGSVARIMEPGCQMDTILVLVGPKGGERKSSLIRELYRVHGCETFRDDLPDIKNARDVGMALEGSWAVEHAELDSIRRADVATLKAFLTRRVDKYSPKYVKGEVVQPRQCVFWGSTNDTEFLNAHDPALRRRFWIVRADKRISTSWIGWHRDEVWAEAFALYQSHQDAEPGSDEYHATSWWFEDETVAEAGRQEFISDDPLAEAVRAYVRQKRLAPAPTGGRHWITSKDIWTGVGYEKLPSDIECKQIVAAMATTDLKRSKNDGARGWWVPASGLKLLK